LALARRIIVGPRPSAWAEIFGDPNAVAAMVDRLVHHTEVIVLMGESYRPRGMREEVLTGANER
jgi:DNA replication protein DnaC